MASRTFQRSLRLCSKSVPIRRWQSSSFSALSKTFSRLHVPPRHIQCLPRPTHTHNFNFSTSSILRKPDRPIDNAASKQEEFDNYIRGIQARNEKFRRGKNEPLSDASKQKAFDNFASEIQKIVRDENLSMKATHSDKSDKLKAIEEELRQLRETLYVDAGFWDEIGHFFYFLVGQGLLIYYVLHLVPTLGIAGATIYFFFSEEFRQYVRAIQEYRKEHLEEWKAESIVSEDESQSDDEVW